MAEAPATRITLLNRIRDIADSDAWAEFATLYGPVVYGFARKRGLQDADASDLVQDVLRSVARNAEKLEYDPKRGTFRGWLYTVARNKIFNFLNSQRNRARGVGDDGSDHDRLDSLADKREDQEAIWELEYQRRLSSLAMDAVKHEFQPATWKAFWATAVDGKTAADIGNELGMTTGAVYVAKSRVLARLREKVTELQDDD
jgi:RNA polymerase sigma factor (sigma-70 family)